MSAPKRGPWVEGYRDHEPRLGDGVFVHDSAVVIGDVEIGERSSVWPGVVLRGDQGSIRVGRETSLQDGTIVHATRGLSHTTVGDRVTVGHRVILHGCRIADDVLVGMGAIVMDNAEVGRWSIIGAGALVPVGAKIPERSLVVGIPGRVVRQVTEDEMESMIRHGHREYVRLCGEYAGWIDGEPDPERDDA